MTDKTSSLEIKEPPCPECGQPWPRVAKPDGNDCSACGLHWLEVRALKMSGNRCGNDGCPMFDKRPTFTAQQNMQATDWLRARADWGNDTGDVVRTILNMLAQPSLGRAVELIEKRRETYIRENCKSIGNGGDWEGTVAQEEYVGELDDIIEMLRKEQVSHGR